MQANKAKNTRPELEMRRLLREAGYPGYRLHWKRAPGHPDIAYPGRRVAIFVNGCFWHRCPHCNPPSPKTNGAFWAAKFATNAARDERHRAALLAAGWRVITVWECQLKDGTSNPVAEIAEALAPNPGRPTAIEQDLSRTCRGAMSVSERLSE